MRPVAAFSSSGPWSLEDHTTVQALVSRIFRGSSRPAINLLETSSIKKKELDELEAYLREYRKKL